MRSPRDMQIIQIDITNACIHECSNCTRFCGHHKKPFFMDFQTFKRAVDSLWDFKGTIGIMGGEPTLHPEFARFAGYLHERIKYRKGEHGFVKPVGNFMAKMQQQEIGYHRVHPNAYGKEKRAIYGAGLWSALPPNYYKHYELIQDVFKMQALNDHANAMYHSPILFSRREAGITDEAWPDIRDACWAQALWSAAVTPKGAFFCEIAAALDMLFDGPGGVPIEYGWWLREPEEFGQYEWCEYCGLALAAFSRDARDEVDDVSPQMAERLKTLDSPKMKAGRYRLIEFGVEGNIKPGTGSGRQKMQHANAWDDFLDRHGATARDVLHVGRLVGITVAEEFSPVLAENTDRLDKLMVAVPAEKAANVCHELAKAACEVEVFPLKQADCGQLGRGFNRLLAGVDEEAFLVYLDKDVRLAADFREQLLSKVLNPGTLIWSTIEGEKNPFASVAGIGVRELLAFSPRAMALARAGFDGVAACRDFRDFIALWDEPKVISFDGANFTDDFPLLEAGKRYLVYGAGGHGERAWRQIGQLGSEIIAYSDSDSRKWGQMLHGIEILSPEKFVARREEADKIVIASDGYPEIIELLTGMGVTPADYMVLAF